MAYQNASQLDLADADLSAEAAVANGIALSAAGSGQRVVIATNGAVVDLGVALTVGAVYVLSANAGGIAPVADLASGWYTTILGVAVGAQTLKIEINASGVQTP